MPANIPVQMRHDRLFAPGQITITPKAQEVLRRAQQFSEVLVARHCSGDFGEVSDEDKNANRMAIARKSQVTSIFSMNAFLLGLGRERIFVHTSISEEWTYMCVESEAGNLV